MHPGRIDRNTAAGRVYRVLAENEGQYVSGWDLTLQAHTSAVSTRISEVRRQLGPGERIEKLQADGKNGMLTKGYYYRLVRLLRGQMNLGV